MRDRRETTGSGPSVIQLAAGHPPRLTEFNYNQKVVFTGEDCLFVWWDWDWALISGPWDCQGRMAGQWEFVDICRVNMQESKNEASDYACMACSFQTSPGLHSEVLCAKNKTPGAILALYRSSRTGGRPPFVVGIINHWHSCFFHTFHLLVRLHAAQYFKSMTCSSSPFSLRNVSNRISSITELHAIIPTQSL